MRWDQSLRQWIVMGALALGGAGALAACSSSSSSEPNGSQCSDGTEGCPCFGNGTCNDGLACLSNLCVSQGSGGGSLTGGTTGSGGATTGGSSSGTGGTGGGTGGGSCGDTMSDPNNCGACGRVCDEPEFFCPPGTGCCVDGQCVNTLIGCIRQEDEFSNCAQYCTSIGETCIAAGCGGRTWTAYSENSMACENRQVSSTYGFMSCDEAPPWDDGIKVRCCCTDNVP